MARKLYDIVAKIGEYQAADGTAKGRWQNVGAVMEGDNGPFIMLAKWFNPAGVQDSRGGESILLSCFAPKQSEGQQTQREVREQPVVPAVREVPSAAKTQAKQRTTPAAKAASDDEIPF